MTSNVDKMASICAMCCNLAIRSTSRYLGNTLPNNLSQNQKLLRHYKNRFLSTSCASHHKERDLEGLKNNPYYDKYSKKIEDVKSSAAKEYLKNITINGQLGSQDEDLLVTPDGELGSKFC